MENTTLILPTCRINRNKHLRKRVWNKRNFDKLNGNCYTCNNLLEYDNFECGHIKSVHHGGDTKLDNLEPICRKCNNDMGTSNLEKYKQLLNYTYDNV